jgi:deoxyribodipyrimidine photo-lyase
MTAALVWFRRDLRDFDHAALAAALRDYACVYCAFVFDTDILDQLRRRGLTADRRVDFIHRSLVELDAALREKGGGLIVRHGRAVEEIPRLAAELAVDAVCANRDYEPAARQRDAAVAAALACDGRAFHDCKDQVIFECNEVLTKGGTPFSVFTPYARAWRARLSPGDLAAHACTAKPGQLAVPAAVPPAPTFLPPGFVPTDLCLPCGMSGGAALFEAFLTRIDRYHATRDFPAVDGTSSLSPHLRCGTVSIRQLVAAAHSLSLQPDGHGAAVWLNELIWREFYQMILWHRPDVAAHAFKPAYDALVWDETPELFAAWQAGRTGYPLVDAAQRQLLQTGWMHNRLRMVTASFLTKDLGIDWRRGEAHFADFLLDYDLAANNGGWQWAASTGCDAQPWFRIFNPVTQSEKFDPQGRFIRRHVPELADVPDKYIHAPWRMAAPPANYPPPIVDHAQARERTLERYGTLRCAQSPADLRKASKLASL